MATDGAPLAASRADPNLLRVHTAPGEAADLQEMLDDDGVEFVEIGHIEEMRGVREGAVLFLSRGLLGVGGTLEAIADLPPWVVVVAADDGARSAATQVGRLFLAAPELAPGEGPLLRALRSAGEHATALERLAAAEGRLSTEGRPGTEDGRGAEEDPGAEERPDLDAPAGRP